MRAKSSQAACRSSVLNQQLWNGGAEADRTLWNGGRRGKVAMMEKRRTREGDSPFVRHLEQTGPFSECKMAVSQNRDLTRFVCNICFYGIYSGRKKQAKPPNSRRKKQTKAKVIRTTQTEEKEQAVIQEDVWKCCCVCFITFGFHMVFLITLWKHAL